MTLMSALLLPLAPLRVAWAILDYARRTSTFLSCAFHEQEDDQATLPALFQNSHWQGIEKLFWTLGNTGLGHVMDGSSRARRLFKKTVQQGRSR